MIAGKNIDQIKVGDTAEFAKTINRNRYLFVCGYNR